MPETARSADGLRALTAHPGWRWVSHLSLFPLPGSPWPGVGELSHVQNPSPSGLPAPTPSVHPSAFLPKSSQPAHHCAQRSGPPGQGPDCPRLLSTCALLASNTDPLPDPASPIDVASRPGSLQLWGQSPDVLGCFLYLRLGYRRCPGGAACRWRPLPIAGSTGQPPTRALRTAVTRPCWRAGIR